MLLTLRRVGLPGKDFFANGLLFRQPFKEGVFRKRPVFQRVGGLFSAALPVISSIDTSENSTSASVVGRSSQRHFIDTSEHTAFVLLFSAAQLIRPDFFLNIGAFVLIFQQQT